MCYDVEFVDPQVIVGYLEMIQGHAPGFRFPFHEGVTFIGRAEGRCEVEPWKKLTAVVEAAQVRIKWDGRCWITGAAYTNPSYLIQKAFLQQYSLEELELSSEYVTMIEHERYGSPLEERTWHEVEPGDMLWHGYGCWRFVFPV